jgi:ParB-like chromosome segregation protein Spo0J
MMTAPEPETPMMAASDERIGDYRVHPVAAMFPLLEGENYEELRESIEVNGQQRPILLQGDVLLDGRNRLRACLDLGIRPRTAQYTGELDVATYIRIANIDRRHLSEDQRSSIGYQIYRWGVEQHNAAKQLSGKSDDGAAGGRGHKKNLTQNSEQGFPNRNERSTAGQIAAQAKVSRYKAEQAIAVAKHAPELAEKVQRGEMKLNQAAKQVKHRHTSTSAASPKWDFAASSDRLRRAVDRELALAGEKELGRIVYALRQIIIQIGGRDK